MDTKAQRIATQIIEAFADVPMPSRAALVAGVGTLDTHFVVEHFGEKPRDQLPARLTSFLGEDLLHMSHPGILYYLPPFLVHLLSDDGHTEDGLMNQVLRLLMRVHDPKRRVEFPALTDAQWAATSSWLGYVAEHADEYLLEPGEIELLTQMQKRWGN